MGMVLVFKEKRKEHLPYLQLGADEDEVVKHSR